jgi:hypothetical protein
VPAFEPLWNSYQQRPSARDETLRDQDRILFSLVLPTAEIKGGCHCLACRLQRGAAKATMTTTLPNLCHDEARKAAAVRPQDAPPRTPWQRRQSFVVGPIGVAGPWLPLIEHLTSAFLLRRTSHPATRERRRSAGYRRRRRSL